MRRFSKITIPVTLLTIAVCLSACGRAGAPLRPSEAAAQAAKENNEPAPVAPVPNAQNKQKRFFLDGLLD